MKVMYMKKFLIILVVLLIILTGVIYWIYTYQSSLLEVQKLNSQYESYYNISILGTQLISIINLTVDNNEQNEIEIDENGYYVDNGENSLHIYINFIYQDEIKTVMMEDIASTGSVAFLEVYSTASFKCTEIDYHEKTGNIKSLTFEEVDETVDISETTNETEE